MEANKKLRDIGNSLGGTDIHFIRTLPSLTRLIAFNGFSTDRYKGAMSCLFAAHFICTNLQRKNIYPTFMLLLKEFKEIK